MPSVEIAELRALALRTIDGATRDLISAARTVYSTPETGFNEFKTSAFIQEQLQSLGFVVETGIARTGMRAELRGANPGPTVAVIAELDALRVPSHPGADPESGAAHACGHHAQTGSLLGVATALSAPELKNALSGNVAFIITPAEEFIEIQDRLALKGSRELEFLSGKQEMIRLGTFDDVDMAMMVHTSAGNGDAGLSIGGTSSAHVSHQVKYVGKSSHAGGAPDKGVNALQAAMLANAAINTQRETFLESDVVRVHGIISNGGSSVNAVPDEVLYEGRVRAKSVETIEAISEQVIRCYWAGALAMGASVEIQEIAGYHALKQNSTMKKQFVANAELILGRDSISVVPDDQTHGGSTDMGDLSTIMPVIHPYANAASGAAHGHDYLIDDYDRAVVAPAKVMTATILDLLGNNAQLARETVDKHEPSMTAEQYVATQRERFKTQTYDQS
ncbi:MAG: amidohydrolase [Dehalococcoidia bacterium]|jgi:amidohydrolase|nr:amidohydrolase [Dehalococcoidia bacterium]MDP7261441.1 amidohydrolase [Dehalococcoidia bacterium]MDP7485153.1 amidohydrolase [Dehalococcoidia bacterium]